MIRRLVPVWLCAVLALLGLAPGAAAQAGAGRLDPGYGKGGATTTSFGVAGEEADAELTLGPQGNALVANGVEGIASRFGADGTWDTHFGKAGRLEVVPVSRFMRGVGYFSASSLTIDGSGRTVAFGALSVPSDSVTNPEGRMVSPNAATVLRFAPDGRRLDPSFGEGRGYVEGSFGLPTDPVTGLTKVTALSGRIDSAGRPVFVAAALGTAAACEGHGAGGAFPEAVVRLTEAGLLDPSFGGGTGISRFTGAGNSPFPFFGLAAGDQPVVAVGRVGTYAAKCGIGTIAYRFGPAGEPLTAFGPGGAREFPTAHVALVEPSGTLILIEGRGRRTLALTAIEPDGSPDPGFGEGGVAIVNVPDVIGLRVEPAAVDAQGRLLLAGFVGSPVAEPEKGQPRSSFVVARLLPNGRPDPSFGKHGWLFTRLPGKRELTSVDAALDSQGRLVLGGIVTKPKHSKGAFTVARFLLGR